MALAPARKFLPQFAPTAATSPQRRVRDRLEACAPEVLLLYGSLSLFFLGRNLIGHFSDRYIGMGHDPDLFMFFFEWWRYALANHLNPFHMTVVWAPDGFNAAWSTTVPLFSLGLMPIEATLGPVVAYNVAILLCPALSAWTGFILCRYITRSYWASLAGGYIFGFSPYMLAHSLGHLTLTMVFLLPIAVYLVLRWLDGELSNRRFVVFFTLILVGQFLSSLEILAAMTGTGAIFLLLTWMYGSDALRQRLWTLVPLFALSYAIVAVVMSPYLYYFFSAGSLPMAANWALMVSARPLTLFVPVSTNLFGGWKLFRALTSGSALWEAGEYIGLPLLMVLWSFARRRWNEWLPRILIIFLIMVTIATFGQVLRIGDATVPLPWRVATFLPVIKMILPARLSVYTFLALSVVAAMWLSDRTTDASVRIFAATAVIISLLPNLSASYWTIPVDTPAFFKNGVYKQYLSPGENVLILPYGYKGDSEAWQASTRMYFNLAGGYVGIVPPIAPSFAQYPIVIDFYDLADIPDADENFKAFLVQKNIGAVIVTDRGKHLWRPVPKVQPGISERAEFSPADTHVIGSLLSGLGVPPLEVGDVTLYRVPLEKLGRYRNLSPTLLQERVATVRLAKLIEAAHDYVSRGFDVKWLTPLTAQQIGLLPPFWVGGVYVTGEGRWSPMQDGLVLGPVANKDEVGVGVLGPCDVLRRLLKEYTPYTQRRMLLHPNQRTGNVAESMEWVLLLEFRPEGLARAAQVARNVALEESTPLLPETN